MAESLTYRRGFYKKTRRGKVVRQVQERYVHDDIGCGITNHQHLSPEILRDMVAQAPHKQLIIIDTNIALHQIDVLEFNCPATSLVVLVQTVLQELKHLNLSVYRRVIELLKDSSKSFIFYPNEFSKHTLVLRESEETMNDANDRAIVKTASYYSGILNDDSVMDDGSEDRLELIFITNDIANKERAQNQGLHSMTMRQYIEMYITDYPELLDLVAADDTSNINQSNLQTADGILSDIAPGEIKFPTHLPMNELLHGIKNKQLFKGTLRCQRDSLWDCYVVVNSTALAEEGESRKTVRIQGMANVNRALDGDVVAIELIQQQEQQHSTPALEDDQKFGITTETTSTTYTSGNASSSSKSGAAMLSETAEPTVEALEGLPTQSATNSSTGQAEAPRIIYGRVAGIVRRSWRQYAGTLDLSTCQYASSAQPTAAASGATHTSTKNMRNKSNNSTPSASATVQFVPVDSRVPRIWIQTRRLDALANCRLLVSIDTWPAHSADNLPLGHFVRNLGADGSKEVETQVLLHEYDVPHQEFSPAVMACLPPPAWRITEDLVAQRSDLRHIPVVSIDPPGCKDIDDALHCVRLPNGRLEAGVHIADVTHFVDPGSPLDLEAAHRSTSTYLVERRLDMLPSLLTTELCSLRSGEDHLAFSVIWEMDDDANIFDVRFCKSAIHSVASLTYDEAQTILDGGTAPPPKSSASSSSSSSSGGQRARQIEESVRLLHKLAHTLRQHRIDMGALTLASPEVRFKLDADTHNPTDVAMYALKEANALVEEWMLLANITVSKQVLRHYPTLGILRRHQPPSREQFAPLVSAAHAVGVSLDISSSKTLADSLDAASRPEDPYFNKLLRILSTRCMMPAQYFCSGEVPKDQWHHYGLAAPVYTHFTSPIRRYADVLVHRLLAASIGVIALPASNADRSKQQEVCAHMNRRHRAAQYAQRASVSLHTLIYFHSRPISKETAYVLSVTEDRCTVLVPRFGIEGSIPWVNITTALACTRTHFDAESHCMRLLFPVAATNLKQGSSQPPVKKKQKKQHKGGNAGNGDEVEWIVRVFDRVDVSIRVVEPQQQLQQEHEGGGRNDASSSSSHSSSSSSGRSGRQLVVGLFYGDIDLEHILTEAKQKSTPHANRRDVHSSTGTGTTMEV